MNIEQKKCRNCSSIFVIAPDDFSFYEKIQVPPPTFCPTCRAIRRMVWWNEHNLYRKKDALTGTEVFSSYPETSSIKVYDRDYWWSDSWDPEEFAREYDVNRSFFEQFHDLLLAVPWPSRDVQRLVNSDYSNQASDLKNCYLVFNSGMSENCLYGVSSLGVRDSIDFYFCGSSELCYELSFGDNCYGCFFSTDVSNSRNVWFSRDCHDCNDCFGCVNLRSKQYYIYNQPYTKESYKEAIKSLNLGSYASIQEIERQVREFWRSLPYRFAHSLQNTKSVGEYLYNSKNTRYSYQVLGAENVAYSQNMSRGIKDSMDYTSWGNNAELIYESINVGENARNIKFSYACWPGCSDLEYCVNCVSSSDCFGCVGLRKKQYCIFNKQYSKEEYESTVARIKENMKKAGEYGEFFPTSLSSLAYNESVAVDMFPKTKAEAESEGYRWRESEERNFQFTISNSQLPDHIADISDTIAKEVIECGGCHRAYRILDRELEFYRRFLIPVPRLCHRCRYDKRKELRNPIRWWKRNCAKCNVEIETTFSPDRPEVVYCEECYQNEVA